MARMLCADFFFFFFEDGKGQYLLDMVFVFAELKTSQHTFQTPQHI